MTAPQLFWVIRNGIGKTGMPSFKTAGATDDDIWSIAAFVKKIPTVTEADYKTWTTPPPVVAPPVNGGASEPGK